MNRRKTKAINICERDWLMIKENNYNNVALLQKVRGRAGNCQKIQENPYSVAFRAP